MYIEMKLTTTCHSYLVDGSVALTRESLTSGLLMLTSEYRVLYNLLIDFGGGHRFKFEYCPKVREHLIRTS
jgi:hypothetical protein